MPPCAQGAEGFSQPCPAQTLQETPKPLGYLGVYFLGTSEAPQGSRREQSSPSFLRRDPALPPPCLHGQSRGAKSPRGDGDTEAEARWAMSVPREGGPGGSLMHSQGHPPPQGDPQLWPLCLVLSGFPSQLSPSSSSSSSSAQLPPPLRAGSCQPHTGIRAPVTDRRGDASAAPTLQGDPRGSGPVPTTDHPHPAPSPEGGAQKRGAPCRTLVLWPVRPH